MQGYYVKPAGERLRLLDHLRGTFGCLAPFSEELVTADLLSGLCADILKQGNDARWMRNTYYKSRSLESVVHAMVDRFSGRGAQSVEAEMTMTLPERERRRIRAVGRCAAVCRARKIIDAAARAAALNRAKPDKGSPGGRPGRVRA